MHVSEAIWNTPVGEEDHHLVCGFRAQRDEVPEHVSILVTIALQKEKRHRIIFYWIIRTYAMIGYKLYIINS
jgi:hypothetical protein